MVRKRSFWLALLALALVSSLRACAPNAARSDQQDGKNPYFQKAKKLYQDRDYKEAVKYYHKALEMDANNASAHLELGLLYEDKLQDYSYAIYHYRRYLELRPNAEKAEYVKQFVDRSMIALAASVPNSPLIAGEEIARLRQENSNLTLQVESFMHTNQVLEQKLVKLANAPEETPVERVVTQFVSVVSAANLGSVAANPPPPATNPPVARPATAQAAQQSPAPPPRPRTYTVQRGDTLYSISQKMYGRKDRWPTIYSANRAVVGPPPSYRLKVGQKLTIPNL
jgi:tetratricopeptide (TPR) repeat protein